MSDGGTESLQYQHRPVDGSHKIYHREEVVVTLYFF